MRVAPSRVTLTLRLLLGHGSSKYSMRKYSMHKYSMRKYSMRKYSIFKYSIFKYSMRVLPLAWRLALGATSSNSTTRRAQCPTISGAK